MCMKFCSKCKEEKELKNFTKRRIGVIPQQYASYCNACRAKTNKQRLKVFPKQQQKKSLKKLFKKKTREERTVSARIANKKWRTQNPQKWQMANRRNKHRRRALGSINIDLWNLKLKTLGFKCMCCWSEEQITIDHILPVALGGDNSIHNLQPLCLTCNKKKFTQHIDYISQITYLKN